MRQAPFSDETGRERGLYCQGARQECRAVTGPGQSPAPALTLVRRHGGRAAAMTVAKAGGMDGWGRTGVRASGGVIWGKDVWAWM